MSPARKLCVYCGSGNGRNPAYMAAARVLGKARAEAGIGLVYGGGSLGLMGEVARSVLENSGHVTGIIPEFLANRERMLTDVNELVVTADMHERKMTMFKHLVKIAKRNGIAGFTAEVLRENERMQAVFNHSGLKVSSHLEEGVYSFVMEF